jgi:hypothetical protein
MERQRWLGSRGTPRGRRRFVHRGQFDAPDTDVHLGGLVGLLMCTRCSPGVRQRRGREHGWRNETRRGWKQGRRHWHTSRCNGFGGSRHWGRHQVRIRRLTHWVCGERLVAGVVLPAWERKGRQLMRNARRTARRPVGHVWRCRYRNNRRGGKRHSWRIARRRFERRRQGRIREAGRRLHRRAPPERLGRKIAKKAAHAVTMPR